MDLSTFLQQLLTVIGPLILALVVIVVGAWLIRAIARIISAGAQRLQLKPARAEFLRISFDLIGWIILIGIVLYILSLDSLVESVTSHLTADQLDNIRNVIAAFVGQLLVNIVGPVIASVLVLIIGSRIIGLTIRISTAVARRTHVKTALNDLLNASIAGIGWILIAVGVLQILHLDTIALAVGGSLSLIALGVASAASGNLGDIIAGVFLASDPDFGTGYTIHSGDIIGTIEHIDLRKTRLRAADGKLHIIPNKQIESNVWIVEERPPEAGPASPIFQIPAFFRRNRPQGAAPTQPTPPTPSYPATPPNPNPLNPLNPPNQPSAPQDPR